MSIEEILEQCPDNLEIFDSFIITHNKLQNYDDVMVSISGGADSDIVIDILSKMNENVNIQYVFFDTGLEYEATKKHLDFLESKYNVKIKRVKAIKPIPTCCRLYGQPFLSKQVSEYIERLQKHGFTFADESFDVLLKKYPKCKVALKWWCNEWGENSRFNISQHKYLKEFMVANPPTFSISNKCCTYAKKKVATKVKNDMCCDLSITGLRKNEGGVRSTAYKNCFSDNSGKNAPDEFRVIFWYTNETKKIYESHYNIQHSECYSKYGLQRTGCAGCPYGRNFEQELKIIEEHEPKLFKAVCKIFKQSYEYTRKYRDYRKMCEEC